MSVSRVGNAPKILHTEENTMPPNANGASPVIHPQSAADSLTYGNQATSSMVSGDRTNDTRNHVEARCCLSVFPTETDEQEVSFLRWNV